MVLRASLDSQSAQTQGAVGASRGCSHPPRAELYFPRDLGLKVHGAEMTQVTVALSHTLSCVCVSVPPGKSNSSPVLEEIALVQHQMQLVLTSG